MNDMNDLSWYFRCTFESDTAKGAVKMTQTAVVDSLVEDFNKHCVTQTHGFIEFDLGPKRSDEKENVWPYKEAVGDSLWISVMMLPDIASEVRAVARHA